MALSAGITVLCLWPVCLAWTPRPQSANSKDNQRTFLHYALNTSNHCYKKEKVSALNVWSVSQEDALGELTVDPIEENYVRKVKGCVFSRVYPTPFSSDIQLAALSEDVLEELLDLDRSVAHSSDFLQFVSGSKTIWGFVPLAHRYGGHQFGVWAGQLGDGRAHLLATYLNRFGERWELQLKGSGKTPYSRDGDGRAVLRSSVREFLCSEAMHYLGIPTSRAASLVVSNDAVWRDQFYNGNVRKERGAMVLRVAKSWFRIGSLEILTHSGEFELLRKLVDFIIKEHFPSINTSDPDRVLVFFSRVVSQTADLVARWMSVGFAHGVCNTDNFSLLSITIDYGPFGFMEKYDADYVPNTSDDEGRYRIGNQANVGMYNLNKLLLALNPLMDDRQKQLASAVVAGFPDLYYQRFTELFRAKLGLLGSREEDLSLIATFLNMMVDTDAYFTMSFRDISEISLKQLTSLSIPQGNPVQPKNSLRDYFQKHEPTTTSWGNSAQSIEGLLQENCAHVNKPGTPRKLEEFWALREVSQHKDFPSWVSAYVQRLQRNPDDSDSERRRRMMNTNPRYVLFNWMAESAVGKAEVNDFSEVRLLQRVLRRPFHRQEMAELAGYSHKPPPWAKNLKVSCSS